MAGRKAEHNPDGNRLTIQFLCPKSTGGKRKAGEIILINGDVPRITVRAPEAMMLETDSPVLSPVRGERNEPANIIFSAKKISEIKNIPIKKVIEVTSSNARDLFHLE